MRKISNYITYLMVALMPIMTFVNISSIKFNLSIGDFIIPVYFLFFLFNLKGFSLKKNFPHFWYFGAYLGIVIISNIYNMHSGVNSTGYTGLASELIKIMTCTAYFYIIFNSFETKEELKRILYAWTAGLWIFMIYGIYKEQPRFMGTFTDPNGAGNYLTLSFFIVIILIFLSDKFWKKAIFCITEIFVLYCLLITMSRGTWVGFGVGAILLCVFFYKKIYKWLLFVLPIIAVVYLLFVYVDFKKDYDISTTILKRMEDITEQEGQFIIRKNLTLEALMMGKDHLIFGVGRGNFILNSTPYADRLYSKDDVIYGQMTNSIPHNTFLGMFGELGITGFVIFSSLFIIAIIVLMKRRDYVAFILLAGAIAFGVQSMILNLENARYLWVFIAACLNVNSLGVLAADNEPSKAIIKKYLIAVYGLLVIVFLFVATKVITSTEIGNTPVLFNIPKSGNPIELHYKIKGTSSNIVHIDVYANEAKVENLISKQGHVNPDGYGYFTIEPIDGVEDYVVEIHSEGEKTSSLMELYYKDSQRKVSFADYKFLSPEFENIFNKVSLLGTGKFLAKKHEKIVLPYSVNEGFEITAITLDDKVDFEILFKKRIEEPTVIKLNYSNENIMKTPCSKNTISIKFDITHLSNDWVEGQTYHYVDTLKGFPAKYLTEIEIGEENYALGEIAIGYEHFADYLDNLDENKIIIISTQNEATNSLDYKGIIALREFGLRADLVGKYKYSYIAVASKHGEFVPFEELYSDTLTRDFVLGTMFGNAKLPFSLSVLSSSDSGGNISNILVNGEEFSKMGRGLNVVVYDLVQSSVVDSVCFDTHTSPFTRILER